jgi:hypothetical protein
MIKPVVDLERILADEKEIYEEIYALEEKKKEAILDRDGRQLEKYSLIQENLLENLSVLEEKRDRVIDDYIRVNNLTDLPRNITLREIVRLMDEDSSHHFIQLGRDLKYTLRQLGSLQQTNERLIKDNIDFFNMLMSELKSSTSIKAGYNSEGKENSKTAGSVLFNKTA